MADFTAWHGKTRDERVKLRDDAAKSGYRFLSLSVHGTTGSPAGTGRDQRWWGAGTAASPRQRPNRASFGRRRYTPGAIAAVDPRPWF
jgi:hypothetical protein